MDANTKALQDLTDAVTGFTASVSAEIGAVTAAIQGAGNDSAAIEEAVSKLNALKGTVDTFTATLAPAAPAVPEAPAA